MERIFTFTSEHEKLIMGAERSIWFFKLSSMANKNLKLFFLPQVFEILEIQKIPIGSEGSVDHFEAKTIFPKTKAFSDFNLKLVSDHHKNSQKCFLRNLNGSKSRKGVFKSYKKGQVLTNNRVFPLSFASKILEIIVLNYFLRFQGIKGKTSLISWKFEKNERPIFTTQVLKSRSKFQFITLGTGK